MIVLDVNVVGLKSCSSSGKIDRDCVFGNRDRPEQPAVSDPGIEIVNLLTIQVKYIKSYERERAVVIAPVRSNELTAHEAHVSFEVEVLGWLTENGMSSRAANGCPTHKAVEVCDRGWFDAGSRQKNMK